MMNAAPGGLQRQLDELVSELGGTALANAILALEAHAGEEMRGWLTHHIIREQFVLQWASGQRRALPVLPPADSPDRRDALRAAHRLLEYELAAEWHVDREEAHRFYLRNRDRFELAERRTVWHAIVQHHHDALVLVDVLTRGASLAAGHQPAWSHVETVEVCIGEWVTELADPVFAAEIGDVIGPLALGGAWHIARVLAMRPARLVPFSEAAASIIADLENAARDRAVTRWYELTERSVPPGNQYTYLPRSWRIHSHRH